MKIVGLEKLEDGRLPRVLTNPLVNVTTLELVLHPTEQISGTRVPPAVMSNLPRFFPSAIKLTFEGLDFQDMSALGTTCAQLPDLRSASFKGCQVHVYGANLRAARD